MTARQRFVIKIVFIIFFIILAPLVIAYTMGYRYNFGVGQVQKTGVLIVNSYPDEADVYLDGESVHDETPSVIKKILPNEYKVEVIKEGYLPWSKKLEVKSGETTFAESIVLFLDQIPRATLEREITDSLFSPNRTHLVYITEEASWMEIWLYKLKNQDLTLVDRRDTTVVDNLNFAWSSGSGRLYIKFESDDNTEQLIYDVEKNKITNLTEYFEEPVDEFKWSRTTDDVFYVRQDNKLASINLLTGQKTFLLSEVSQFFVRGNNIYLIAHDDGKTVIGQFDILNPMAETAVLYELPFAKYRFEDSSYPYLLIRKNDKELLLFDTSAPFTEPILQEEARGFGWFTTSQGEKKLLYYKDFEIWIFYPQSKYNELITRFSSLITDAIWHRNGEYIFFSFENTIKVIELDPRDQRNTFNLIEDAQIAGFTVDYNSKNLYFVGTYDQKKGLYYLPLIDD